MLEEVLCELYFPHSTQHIKHTEERFSSVTLSNSTKHDSKVRNLKVRKLKTLVFVYENKCTFGVGPQMTSWMPQAHFPFLRSSFSYCNHGSMLLLRAYREQFKQVSKLETCLEYSVTSSRSEFPRTAWVCRERFHSLTGQQTRDSIYAVVRGVLGPRRPLPHSHLDDIATGWPHTVRPPRDHHRLLQHVHEFLFPRVYSLFRSCMCRLYLLNEVATPSLLFGRPTAETHTHTPSSDLPPPLSHTYAYQRHTQVRVRS